MVVEKEIKYSTYAMLPIFCQFLSSYHCDDCWNFTYCLAISPLMTIQCHNLWWEYMLLISFPKKTNKVVLNFMKVHRQDLFRIVVTNEISCFYYRNEMSFWLKKVIWCLTNCVFTVILSLKNRVHVFGKFY